MTTIRLTAKRQATFPRRLCEEMHLEPGNAIQVEPREVDGQRVWVLAPVAEESKMNWVGSLRRYSKGKHPSMDEVRTQIQEAMANGDLD